MTTPQIQRPPHAALPRARGRWTRPPRSRTPRSPSRRSPSRRWWSPWSWSLPARAALAGGVLLLATTLPAVFGSLPTVLKLSSIVVALANGGFGLHLMMVAARRHFGRGPVGPRHSVGLHAAGLICAAAVAGAVALQAFAGGHEVAYTAAVGLALATGAFVPAIVMLPGGPRGLIARLRRGLDGLIVGTCLLFAAWVLVIAPRGVIVSITFWVAVITCCQLAVAVVAGLRAARSQVPSQVGVLGCAGGACLSVVGLAGVTVTMAGAMDSDLIIVFFGLLAVSPVSVWLGVRGLGVPEDPGQPDPAETFTGYPALAIPVATALTVAGYHALTGGDFDRPSVLLGVAAVVGVALRETLGAFDLSRYARRVAAAEAQYRSLVSGSSDVIMVLDRDLIVRWQSPAAARQLGLSDQEVVGRHFQSMLHPDDATVVAGRIAEVCAGGPSWASREMRGLDRPALVEARIRDGFGRWRETESSVSDQREVPEVGGLVVHIRDVTERKDTERMLHRLAYADQLTGLANRRQMFLSVVSLRSMARSRGAVLLLALEGFSTVSDARGYDIGDAVLVEVARRLRTVAAESDLLARLSGDEFAVVTEGGPVQAYALASRLLATLTEPIALAGVTVFLTVSIGLTDVVGGIDGADVLRRAGLALRRAQQLGGGRIEWHDEVAERDMIRQQALERELPGALDRGELDVIYQPMLDLADERPVGVEALLRWRHPRLGTLLPCDIVPLAEQLGLIADIGSWVLRQAVRQLTCWLREGRDLWVAVNLSPQQLTGCDLVADVASVLALHRVPPERLVLEISEGELGGATDADEGLARLRALGVRTALDKFGTGADSLAHLRRLPIDMVKIDRSFLDELAGGDDGVSIMDVLVGLGRRLGIEVIAQGIEIPGHLDLARTAGCRIGQGHLFARPQPAEHIEAYLDSFGVRPT